MGWWNDRRETELERELRAQRPQPPAELMQRLSHESAARRLRPRFVPRLALVSAVTVVLAASLGAAGAVGYATKSAQNLGTCLFHIVQPPPPKTTGAPSFSNSSKGGKGDDRNGGNHNGGNGGNGGNGNGNGNGGNGGNGNGGNGGNGNGDDHHGDDHGHDPFHHEYDHHVPICHGGQTIYVPSQEYFYRLLHGDGPAPCPPHHRGR
jgi:hypothetical protein